MFTPSLRLLTFCVFFKLLVGWPTQGLANFGKKFALIALYQGLEHLQPDEPEDSKMKMEFNSIVPRLHFKLQQIAGIHVLKAFDDKRVNGQLQIVDDVGNASAYISLPGRRNNQQLAHYLPLDPLSSLTSQVDAALRIPQVTDQGYSGYSQFIW